MPQKKQPIKDKQPISQRAKFLKELVDKYTYWASLKNTEADEFATAYERLICSFTMPSEDKK